MARTRNSDADENAAKADSAPAPAPENTAGGDNLNSAERQELRTTVDTETGEIIHNATGVDENAGEGESRGPAAPGTDPSTAEKIKVKTSGDFLFHDPFSNSTVDNSDDGGYEDGIVKTALVQNALDDGRLVEI